MVLRGATRESVVGLALPLVFLVLCMTFGVTELHFDVLERSYLIEHPSECLTYQSGTRHSQYLFYGHMLELPLASIVGLQWLGLSGTRSLVLFESICGAAALFFVYRIVRAWGGGVRAGLLAQLLLMASLSFWRMASGGEERIAALASQLGFLWAFWSALQSGRRIGLVAASLAVAILVHLSGAVLVPFAVAALFLRDRTWSVNARRVARAVGLGTLVAGTAFVAVAVLTAGVRTPAQLFEYATFYHRPGGINFFELTVTEPLPGNRLGRMVHGMGGFFGVVPWGQIALAELVVLLAVGAFLLYRRRSLNRLRWLGLHGALLAALWTLHFAFYQPQSYESWTLPLTLGIVIAAVLWSSILPAVLLALPLTFVPGNWSYMVRLHHEDSLHVLRRALEDSTSPGDIIVLQGGRVDGNLTEGSLLFRYALAFMRDRRIVSLHDILSVGDGEFWRPLFRSPSELQAAIDAGAKVYSPGSLVPIYERVAATGAIEVGAEWVTPGLVRLRAFRPLRDHAFTPEQLSLGAVRPSAPVTPPAK